MPSSSEPYSPLRPEDLALLHSLEQGGNWLRAVLCTLARRGRALRDGEPERARALLDALSVYPWFKAGQFLFDLMEWEDFMLDGPPPPLMSTTLDAAALARITATLHQIRQHLDGSVVEVSVDIVRAETELPTDLPPLESSMLLYQDVALGVVLSCLPTASI